MSQVIFDFSELIADCLHDQEINFTNAIVRGLDSKKTISELFKDFKLVCRKELRELLEMDHSHLVKSRYIIVLQLYFLTLWAKKGSPTINFFALN